MMDNFSHMKSYRQTFKGINSPLAMSVLMENVAIWSNKFLSVYSTTSQNTKMNTSMKTSVVFHDSTLHGILLKKAP